MDRGSFPALNIGGMRNYKSGAHKKWNDGKERLESQMSRILDSRALLLYWIIQMINFPPNKVICQIQWGQLFQLWNTCTRALGLNEEIMVEKSMRLILDSISCIKSHKRLTKGLCPKRSFNKLQTRYHHSPWHKRSTFP